LCPCIAGSDVAADLQADDVALLEASQHRFDMFRFDLNPRPLTVDNMALLVQSHQDATPHRQKWALAPAVMDGTRRG
jgi:hypothetical protein